MGITFCEVFLQQVHSTCAQYTTAKKFSEAEQVIAHKDLRMASDVRNGKPVLARLQYAAAGFSSAGTDHYHAKVLQSLCAKPDSLKQR